MNENDESKNEHGDGPPQGPRVKITVDTITKEVHRGNWLITELKAATGVDPNRVLDQLVEGQLIERADNARVTIKGGEVFISHVRQGGSS